MIKKEVVEDIINEELEFTDKEDYKSHTLEELNNLLNYAVVNEDYEKAAKIRDEISKR